MKVEIIGTGSALPDRIVKNEEISDNPEWVSRVLGVDERRRVANGQLSSDLAVEAAINTLEDAKLEAESIELLIVATISPDKLTPSTACIVQERIGANKAVAFDISAACTGFLYGFLTAAQFVSSGSMKTAMIIGVDSLSRYTDYGSRDAVYFGDGAGAAIIQRSDQERILSSKMVSDGKFQDLYVINHNDTFKMDGAGVTNYAGSALPGLIEDVLADANLIREDIDLIICHQPSKFALQKVAELSGIPFEKFRSNLQLHSNTAGASVPLLMDQVVKREGINSGSTVLFLAVGAGMTCAAALYKW